MCEGLPPEFPLMLHYVRNLEFDATPDYSYLQRCLKQMFVRENYAYLLFLFLLFFLSNDGVYDWVALRRNKGFHANVASATSNEAQKSGSNEKREDDPQKSRRPYIQPIPPFNAARHREALQRQAANASKENV